MQPWWSKWQAKSTEVWPWAVDRVGRRHLGQYQSVTQVKLLSMAVGSNGGSSDSMNLLGFMQWLLDVAVIVVDE